MAIPFLSDITFNNPDNEVGIYFAPVEGTYVKYSGGGSGDLMLGAEDQVNIRSSSGGSDELIASFSDTVLMQKEVTFVEDAKFNKALNFQKTGFTTITGSSNTFNINFATATNNYQFTLDNAACTIAFANLSANVVGKSGNIIITNPSSVGSLSVGNLPSAAYSPGGATINWDTNASSVSILSYFILASDKVLINYVGNFKSYGT